MGSREEAKSDPIYLREKSGSLLMFSIGTEGNYYFGKWEGGVERDGGGKGRDLAETAGLCTCVCVRQTDKRDGERETKTRQLAQLSFHVSPAEKCVFFPPEWGLRPY